MQTPALVRLIGEKRLKWRASSRVFVIVLVASAGCASVGSSVDAIDTPLTNAPGDSTRGKEVFVSRDAGNCVLCHAAPGVSPTGNIAPPLQGVGSRLTAAQLRLRVVDITRLNPDAAMPAFHRVGGLQQVAARYRDQPVLSGQQVEDVIAYLGTLK